MIPLQVPAELMGQGGEGQGVVRVGPGSISFRVSVEIWARVAARDLRHWGRASTISHGAIHSRGPGVGTSRIRGSLAGDDPERQNLVMARAVGIQPPTARAIPPHPTGPGKYLAVQGHYQRGPRTPTSGPAPTGPRRPAGTACGRDNPWPAEPPRPSGSTTNSPSAGSHTATLAATREHAAHVRVSGRNSSARRL